MSGPSISPLDDPTRFGFFQAVRLILAELARQKVQEGESRIGFAAPASLNFPASEIQEVKGSLERELKLVINFFGLTGPSGILPHIYTEHLITEERAGSSSTGDFLDIFNSRLAWQFYAAWEKHRLEPAYEREGKEGFAASRVTRYLYSLLGLGTPHLQSRLGEDGKTLLSYAGLLYQRPRNASSLGGFIGEEFAVSVQVVQCQGEWVALPDECLAWLNGSGTFNQLGCGAMLGNSIWDPQARVQLRIGPLTYSRYTELLPGGKSFGRIGYLVGFYLDWNLRADINLVLRGCEVPLCSLKNNIQLGLDSWLDRDLHAKAASDFECLLVA